MQRHSIQEPLHFNNHLMANGKNNQHLAISNDLEVFSSILDQVIQSISFSN